MENEKPQAQDFLKHGLSLDGLIAYQEGSVVSKALMQRLSGTVTLFAFDQGQGLSEHTAPFDALVYIVDGQAHVRVDGEDYHPSAGEMLIMPAGSPHSLQAEKRFKMMLVMIKE